MSIKKLSAQVIIFISTFLIFTTQLNAGLAPISKAYLNFNRNIINNAGISNFSSSENIGIENYLNPPVDLSHLANNIPDVEIAVDIPTTYDLRNLNYISLSRDQWQWSTSWAFAAIASVESNWLTQNPEERDNFDLSEFHLAWFARFNNDRRKTFTPLNDRLENSYTSFEYGNELMALALLTKLVTPLNENEMLPYLNRSVLENAGVNADDWITKKEAGRIPNFENMYSLGLIPSRETTPDFYGTPEIRLTDAIYATPTTPGSALLDPYQLETDFNISSDIISKSISVDEFAIVKNLILDYGAVEIAYHSNGANSDYLSSPDRAYYYDINSSRDSEASNLYANNTVVIAGWDDNYSRTHFNEEHRPQNDGAWLIKSSWANLKTTVDVEIDAEDESGTETIEVNVLDDGYFWMSYEQPIEWGLAFKVEAMPENLKHYGYDELGWCNSYGFGNENNTAYAANVFKILSEGEILEAISFYTTDNNCEYEFYVYDLGTTKPRTPLNGDLIISGDGVQEYSGYHTIKLNDLLEYEFEYGHYFSVVLKLTTPEYKYPLAVEVKIAGYSDFASAHDGESYFSSDGNAWLDGAKITQQDDFFEDVTNVVPMNACIKAFTIAPNPISDDADEEVSINNIPVKKYPTIRNFYQLAENDNGQVEELILTLPETSPDTVVNLYFVDRKVINETTSLNYEFYDDFAEYIEHPQKGLMSLEEWTISPFMTKGYLPDEIWEDDSGFEYPVWGSFRNQTRTSGDIFITVHDLRHQDNGLGHIPDGNYYRLVYSPDVDFEEGKFIDALGELALSASNPDESQNNNSSSSGSVWRSREYNSCNFGGIKIFTGMILIVLLILLVSVKDFKKL